MGTSISDSALLAEGVSLGHNVIIEDDVRVGTGCEIGHAVVIHAGTVIGDNVSIAANSVVGKQPRSGASSRRKTGSKLPLQIGDGVVIGACVVLYAGTVIEEDVLVADLAGIREDCHISRAAIIGRSVMVECHAFVGPRSRIQTASHLTGNVVIEEDVFLGAEVVTMNDNTMGRGVSEYSGPRIKKRARVGCNATILPGVVIGEDAIVGAGAVVTKDIPDGQTYVGVPAAPIRRHA
jgi:acetyltransferase-like isoleucine patch superfamily enzyme